MYHQSFGGRPINLPDVTQHSTIDANTDKVCSDVFSLTVDTCTNVNASCNIDSQLIAFGMMILASENQHKGSSAPYFSSTVVYGGIGM